MIPRGENRLAGGGGRMGDVDLEKFCRLSTVVKFAYKLPPLQNH
jgi:hypothetical protein